MHNNHKNLWTWEVAKELQKELKGRGQMKNDINTELMYENPENKWYLKLLKC